MTVDEAVAYLNEQKNPMIRPGLTVITELMKQLGNPQDRLRYIHIAGTNGKGSVAAYLESILRRAGYKTGLFTSPYIQRFSEKIRVDHRDIGEEILVSLTERVKEAADQLLLQGLTPTPFELQTAVAFLFFDRMQCDIVILETGLGGRLDATNVIREAEVSVLCSISYDHMDYLGSSLEEIAFEKAGIIKPGARVVAYPQEPEARAVIENCCREREADLLWLDKETIHIEKSGIGGQSFRMAGHPPYTIHMLGPHQIYNASLAVMAAEGLRGRGFPITDEAISHGLEETRWQGRLEIVHDHPLLIVDGAHNVGGAAALAESLKGLFPQGKITFIVGVLRDKEYEKMLDHLFPIAGKFYTVTPNSPRALPAEDLAAFLREKGFQAEAFPSVPAVLDRCLPLRAQDSALPDRNHEDCCLPSTTQDPPPPGQRQGDREEVFCAFGSLYYIGEVRELLSC